MKFDEAHNMAVLTAEASQVEETVIVHASLDHDVELDGAEPCLAGSSDPGPGRD